MDEERAQFDHELEMNLAYSIPGVGRFRVNIFKQRNEISMVAKYRYRDSQRGLLGLPDVLKEVIMQSAGWFCLLGYRLRKIYLPRCID